MLYPPHRNGSFPITSMTMARYVMYKHKIINIKDKRFSKITSNSTQNHLWLKMGWHKDAKSWRNHWGVEAEVILHNIDAIISTIISKFKEKL